jgi:hypothetical protein
MTFLARAAAGGGGLISPYVRGLRMSVDGGGGHFGNAAPGLLLQGPGTGFSVLIHFATGAKSDQAETYESGIQLLCGSLLAPGTDGWLVVYTEGVISGIVGDASFNIALSEAGGGSDPIKEYLFGMEYDPSSGGSVRCHVNGYEAFANAGPVSYAASVSQFFIGGVDGTTATNLEAAFGVGDIHGNIDTPIMGVGVSSQSDRFNLGNQNFDIYEAFRQNGSLAAAMGGWNAEHLYTVKNGLPALVDAGSEVWADEVGSIDLSRIGTQALATRGEIHQAMGDLDPNSFPAP